MGSSFPVQKPKWADLSIIHENTLPPRSAFYNYTNKPDALTYDPTKSQSVLLSGKWKFHLAPSPFETPEGFIDPGYDVSSWHDIVVPGIWQLQGHGKGPQYVNVQYPFPVDLPNPPFDNNETGCYTRVFEISNAFSDHQLRLRFEGCDSAASVFLNGKELGYSQGSRNPFEFDVTDIVNSSGKNTLAVRVYQYCDGSYIEDQDQWRFSGIFRDVRLIAFPKERIEDFHVRTVLDEKYRDATLSISVDVTGNAELQLQLLDADRQIVVTSSETAKNGRINFQLQVKDPHKWTAETPYLYHLVLSYGGQVVPQRVGFRKIEIKNGVYMVNGKKVVFRGANRHEHHPQFGRAVPYEFLRNDLLSMKEHNINAIRTCHQPSDPRLYNLCDDLGLWVMDEADLECHGFSIVEEMALPEKYQTLPYEDKKKMLNKINGKWTSDNPVWTDAYVDRARQLVSRDKNHACVVMWSLGNEAFYGRNFQAMYEWIKSYDETRPVHYEGDLEQDTVDVYSKMYPKIEEIVEYAARAEKKKPLVLCEYIHAMGNGPGNIKEYIDAFYQYPSLMGGFEWEWANHGLKTKTADGEEFYGYGGDFGDIPNDSNFVMDGMLYSDHTPSPGLLEYAKAIEPVQVVEGEDAKVLIINRYDFVSLDHLRCHWSLIGDGFAQEGGELDIPSLSPGNSSELKLPPLDVSSFKSETYIDLSFSLAERTDWASSGHVVARSQIQLKPPVPLPPPTTFSSTSSPISLSNPTPTSLQITTPSTTWTFSLAQTRLTSWLKDNSRVELLHNSRGPKITIYRALTDNDRPADGADWLSKHVNLAVSSTRSVTYTHDPSTSTVTVNTKTRLAPPVLSWSIDTISTYTFTSAGTLRIHVHGTPRGKNLPSTLPRIGLTLALPSTFTKISYFGRGPGESYIDKKLSQHFGNYTATTVDDLWTPYEYPQESSNRTDVRHITLSTSASTPPSPTSSNPISMKASFGSQPGFSFQACHYETADVDAATHPHELEKKKKDYVVLRLDARHHGLGTGSCGPKTLEKYALKCQEFEFEVLLE